MSEIYCDILPQPTGWVFAVEGAHSPAYPSYRLAFEAAQRYRDSSSNDRHRIVLRHQDLKGQMRRVTNAIAAPAFHQVGSSA